MGHRRSPEGAPDAITHLPGTCGIICPPRLSGDGTRHTTSRSPPSPRQGPLPLSFFDAFAHALACLLVIFARDLIDNAPPMPQRHHRFAGQLSSGAPRAVRGHSTWASSES